MIVALEGIDACGKATQAARLAQHLKCEVVSFPDYSTVTGKVIGDHLHEKWYTVLSSSGGDDVLCIDTHVDATVFQALMLTNKMEKAAYIQSQLLARRNLVLDRYWPSAAVYGAADGLDFNWLVQIHQVLPQAHHHVLLDIDPAQSVRRRPERRDRYEKKVGLMIDVAKRYRDLWHDMQRVRSSSWHIIDANRSIDAVTDSILAACGVR